MATGTDRTAPTAMQLSVSIIVRASFLLSIVTLIATAQAETLTYGVNAGVGETDNVTLAHTDRISQTIAVTNFDLDYQAKSQRLDVDAKGNFSYLDYLQGAYGGKLFGRFDGTGDLALIPQRLTWAVQEDYGQAAINPFTPTTPINVENINYVATGPDLYLRPGGASFVDMSARVAHTQYDISPFTNSRAMGSLALGFNLSSLSSVSVNGDTQRVLFENTALNTDFERSNAFIRYELKGARTEVSADLGATVISANATSTTSSLAKFKLARRLSASARLTLNLGHDSTDGSTSFSGGPQGGVYGPIGASPATNTSANYISKYGSVGWEYQRNRTTLGLSGRWEEDTYDLSALDRKLVTADVQLRRRLTHAFTLLLAGDFGKSNYGNANLTGRSGSPTTTTSLITAAVTWRHGRALEVKLAGEHTIYTTSPYDSGYRESRIFLTIGYRPAREAQVGDVVPGI
jgi:hypothetical protein